MTRRCCAVMFVAVAAVCGAAPAQAQTESGWACGTTAPAPLVSGTWQGITHLPSKETLPILAVGAAAALGAHAADSNVSEALTGDRALDRVMKPGAMIGGMPFEMGAAVAMVGLSHTIHKPCLASLGSELLQAQLVGAAWTIGIKQVTRRDRPEGTGYSFPSGHTATAFASATVLQRRFGWKVGIPAYGVASYVAASRVEMQRHYLSDVVFGAALGIAAGHTVSVGHGHQFAIGPMATSRGAGVSFSMVK